MKTSKIQDTMNLTIVTIFFLISTPFLNSCSGSVSGKTVSIPSSNNDSDADGIPNSTDNCPNDSNVSQLDTDLDSIGDVCDDDKDGDGILNVADNCEIIVNQFQKDLDNDGLGNECDQDFSSKLKIVLEIID